MIHLDQDEKIVAEVRKHWFVLVPYVIALVFIFLAPLVVYVLLKYFDFQIPVVFVFTGNVYFLSIFFYALWALAIWITWFVRWTDHYFDVWYITTKRVIDVDQKGFFNREISTLYYEKIQDITISTGGIIQTFLDFGDVFLQTAGDKVEFWIKDAKHPNEVKRIISEQYHRIHQTLHTTNRTSPAISDPNSIPKADIKSEIINNSIL